MTPLPAAIDPATAAELVVWRLDDARHADTWDSGIGAAQVGGRWNPKGLRAVYCSIDPATCLVEAAVHRGFEVLDTRPHVLTSLTIAATVFVVRPEELPNPAWLHAGIPSAGQQRWGAALLLRHGFVVLPSAVSKLSWNLVFTPLAASGQYTLRSRSRLALDTRLNPPHV